MTCQITYIPTAMNRFYKRLFCHTITHRFLWLFALPVWVCHSAFAQAGHQVILEGKVINAQTNEPVPFAALISLKLSEGTVSGEDGQFLLKFSQPPGRIKFSSVGYKTDTIDYKRLTGNNVIIKLDPVSQELKEVVVKPPKIRYRNKGNPAVELIEKVIARKASNRQGAWDFLENRKYEKIILGFSNFTERFPPEKISKNLQFIFNHVDTTYLKGQKVLPLYMQEKLADNYYTKTPPRSKEVVTAIQSVDFGKYFSMDGISAYLKTIYEDINLYDNTISFLTNQFVSPIANLAPSFYQYFIIDTTTVDNVRCINLFFIPRNKADMLFQGNLYITLDSCYAVKKAAITVNKAINLNWIKEVNISLEYMHDAQQGWLPSSEKVGIDFGLPNTALGVYGQRTTTYAGYKINIPRDESFYKPATVTTDSALQRTTAYWTANRPHPLVPSEAEIYAMVDTLTQVPVVKRSLDWLYLLIYGYKTVGNFALGSIYDLFANNPVEGFRAQVGGKTTSALSPHFYLAAYGAYGFTDKTFKYSFTGAVGLTSKSIFRFPANYLKISYQYDAQTPGNELQISQPSNPLSVFMWGMYNKFFYNRIFQIDQLHEYKNHFSYDIGYKYVHETPRGILYFNYSDYDLKRNDKAYLPVSELFCTLRYAPNEKFYQEQLNRYAMTTVYPVVELNYTIGNKLIGNDYNYQKIRLSVTKRFRLSALGYSDVTLEGAKLFGTVPYPLLFIHQATQTYFFDDSRYNTMDFLEFVSDHYAAITIDHCFNGFILNKIPLFKKLSWREYISCKALYGGIRQANDPQYNSQLFRFPTAMDGASATYPLSTVPYVEVSAGVGNILRFFRVDFVKRLTYLNHPGTSSYGIRLGLKMDF